MSRDTYLPEQHAFSFTQRGQQVQRLTTRDYYHQHPTQKQQRPATTTRQRYIDDEDLIEYDRPSITPKSAIRYRPIHEAEIDTRQGVRVEHHYHDQPIIQRRSRQQEPEAPPIRQRYTEEPQAIQSRRRGFFAHPILYLGVGMLLMLALWVGGQWLVSWWTNTQNDWTYTQAFRTFSVDKAVGHNHDSTSQPTHFIVQNDNRHVVIIEFPADKPEKALIYIAPTLIGDGEDKTPVTISFQRNSQTGRLDMMLHVEDQTFVYTNNGTKFVSPSGQ